MSDCTDEQCQLRSPGLCLASWSFSQVSGKLLKGQKVRESDLRFNNVTVVFEWKTD